MRKYMRRLLAGALAVSLFLIAGAAVAQESGNASNPPEAKEITVDLAKVTDSISLDGKLSEDAWQQATAIDIPAKLGAPEKAKNDLSGQARFFWNDSALYIGIRVTDDKLFFTEKPKEMREYDSAEVWVDKLWIEAGPDKAGNPIVKLSQLGGFPPYKIDYQVGIAQSDTGYTIELAIPAQVLQDAVGEKLGEGETLKIAAGLKDRDDEKNAAKAPLYYPAIFGWNNVESMATARLK